MSSAPTPGVEDKTCHAFNSDGVTLWSWNTALLTLDVADLCSGSTTFDGYLCTSGTCPVARPGAECTTGSGENISLQYYKLTLHEATLFEAWPVFEARLCDVSNSFVTLYCACSLNTSVLHASMFTMVAACIKCSACCRLLLWQCLVCGTLGMSPCMETCMCTAVCLQIW